MLEVENNEREKYEMAWRQPWYRSGSPGERILTLIQNQLNCVKGDSLIDFGAGCGRPAQWFYEQGLKVTAIDIAKNCLDGDVTVPLVIAPLWRLPLGLRADFGICTDVLEHLPEDKLEPTLKEIKATIKNKTFFQVALFPHEFKGETLHLSVFPSEFWQKLMSSIFSVVHWEHTTSKHYCCTVS